MIYVSRDVYDMFVELEEATIVDDANTILYGDRWGPTPPVGPSQFDTVEEDRGER